MIIEDVFGFLKKIPPYCEAHKAIERLNGRHQLIIDPFISHIKAARVLDVACHDGRWSYALARAGAREVIGVEARPELLDRFALFPDAPFKKNVSLRCADLFAELENLAAQKEAFEVVALYGIFYHVIDHFRLLSLVRKLRPKIVIIDSEFIETDNAMVQILQEDVSNPLNATGAATGVAKTVVGVPSRRATEFMAAALDFEITWIDPSRILGAAHTGMNDYFRDGRKVRGTCALTPK